eukprot:TRINITY_DN12844_c0_g1_i1.p1 TRINITY_DN12844_c0_g1~~TRINITY_DN12844_c0_g1_i1.p1  ORF type:complete len:139 (+),score=34.58 TRINITY_DN12844_c0_g1_i1:149-565(+)
MATSKNQQSTDSQESEKPITLNPNAVPYVFKPSAKPADTQPVLSISVDAKPFVPKSKREVSQHEDTKHEIPPDALEEFEDDLLDQLDNDPAEWLKECQDCPCCQGWVYICTGEACKYLNSCYCKIKLDIEQGGTVNST